jgi:hypothetical protein
MPLTPEEQRARWRAYMRKYRKTPKAKATQKAYQLANKDKIAATQTRWRKKNMAREAERARDWYRAHPEHQKKVNEAKAASQQAEAGRPRPDACEVCGGNKGGIVFDHCHQKGHFRGWLCSRCNSVLGYVEDDPNRLVKLAAYLTRTSAIDPPQRTIPGL